MKSQLTFGILFLVSAITAAQPPFTVLRGQTVTWSIDSGSTATTMSGGYTANAHVSNNTVSISDSESAVAVIFDE